MTPKERLIQQLIALCKKHGVEVVAAEARVSADNLKQITSGTKLPSGEPRGVGPSLQRKLEAKFPGWADVVNAAPPAAPPPRFADRRQVSESDWGLLDDVKLVLPDSEIERIRNEAERVRRIARQQIAETANGPPSRHAPPPRENLIAPAAPAKKKKGAS